MNKILLIFFANSQPSLHFLSDKDAQEADKYVKKLPEIFENLNNGDKIVKYFLLSELPHMDYFSAIILDSSHQISYDKQKTVDIKLKLIRDKRDKMLQDLDIPYQISTQRGNKNDQAAITEKMEKLRNLPQLFKPELFDRSEDIINLDVFKDIG